MAYEIVLWYLFKRQSARDVVVGASDKMLDSSRSEPNASRVE